MHSIGCQEVLDVQNWVLLGQKQVRSPRRCILVRSTYLVRPGAGSSTALEMPCGMTRLGHSHKVLVNDNHMHKQHMHVLLPTLYKGSVAATIYTIKIVPCLASVLLNCSALMAYD